MASDEQDLAAVFVNLGGVLARSARTLVPSEADAEDAVQEAMLAALCAPHLFAAVECAGSWLYTLVRRRCVDILRRDRVRQSNEREAALEELFVEAPDALEYLERQELIAALARAVKRLDEPLRSAFVENALEGRTFREIFEQSGIPMGTLMARKQRAVEAIKRELQQEGFSPLAHNK
ncbi:MAG TPA: sigma-70 family RNA polymerase sigma factor [Anaeromyxobacteraceae bacterium]|nr:sigma-70 family RNA polymerase sigma factor [Anaeromyxobacteraceae bacterium]